ncbi:MAG: Ig-like domain-containing protein, partial [Clostridia bacterium]|nr:Ig-like domain-containing protein [Clostridia bacterium]
MKRKNALRLLLAPIALSALAFGVMEMNLEPLSASAGTEIQLVEIDERAAIRTANPYGIRFIGNVNATLEEANTMILGADVEFTYNGQEYSAEVTADNTKLYEQTAGGNAYFNIALVDLEDDAFNVEFSVKAWVKETAASEKVYSATTATRSIAYVAGRAKAAGETASILDTIINTASANFALSTDELAMKTGQIKAVSVSGTGVDVVKYEITDTSVATVDNAGNVTAIKAGSTELIVTIGNNQRTCDITVTDPVAMPLDLTNASGLTLGGYELTVGKDYVVSDALAVPDLFAAVPDTAEEIVAYKQVIGETVTPLTATDNANELKGVQAGESTQFRFEEADGDYYYADLPVYTLVISDKDELLNMTKILDANKVDNGLNDASQQLYSSGGYFVLDSNVDYNANFCNQFSIDNVASDKHGFTGVFDGRGYTISGIRLRRAGTSPTTNVSYSRGLFGSLTSSAVVKNVNFDNVCHADIEVKYTGILGYFVNGTVSNISVTFTNENSQGLRANSGTLAYQIGASARLNNIVVQIKDITYAGDAGWLARVCNVNAQASHVYVINTTAKSYTYTYVGSKDGNTNF